MWKFSVLFSFLFLAPVWTSGVVLDVNQWQLPDEPEPAAVKPPPQPVQPRKPAPADGKEITIEMGAVFAPTSAKNDNPEIAVLKRSAEQLQQRLKGKGRFYVVFNADMEPSLDTQVETPEGLRYALVRFGPEKGPYRLFLFEGEGNQKLLAVAENLEGQLRFNRIFDVPLDITEADFTKAFPRASMREITAAQQTPLHTYTLSGPVFVVFSDGKLLRQFSDVTSFNDYTNRWRGLTPSPAVRTVAQSADTEQETPAAPEPIVYPKTSFKALIKEGTLFDRKRRAEEEAWRRQQEEMNNAWQSGKNWQPSQNTRPVTRSSTPRSSNVRSSQNTRSRTR